MKYLALAGAVIASLLSASLQASQSYPLLAVEDGDTLVVMIEGHQTRVQLAGIDAPENVPNPKFLLDKQRTQLEENRLLALGEAATDYLSKLLTGAQHIELTGNLSKQDKYGRTLAEAFDNNGTSINQRMVREGYAIGNKHMKNATELKKTLQKLQVQASKTQSGLWQLDKQAMSLWSGIPLQ